MRDLILKSLVIGLIAISCSSVEISELERIEHLNAESYPQKWELVKMTGSIANQPASTGTDMAWQEYYVLFADGNFIKSRTHENTTGEEIGTYTFKPSSDTNYLELSYKYDSELIGNCSSEPMEFLILDDSNMLVATWWACDGPGLFYKRVE
ncbi:MAG: hypothetical protein AAGG59_17270 [Bacteroidota bacterium]